MGHKVSPLLLRLGIHQTWRSRWFAPGKRTYRTYLQEDIRIREFLKSELRQAAVGKVEIERSPERVRLLIHTARPGMLIWRRGENIQRIQDTVTKMLGAQKQLKVDYVEIQNPHLDANLLAESIAFQLEKRIAHRRAMKRILQQAMESGAKGIKIVCAGRLGGSEMKRRESYKEGKVPSGTLRSNIEFGTATAQTPTGCIGIKVWLYKGDVIKEVQSKNPAAAAAATEPAVASSGDPAGAAQGA